LVAWSFIADNSSKIVAPSDILADGSRFAGSY
jgi:hypothetical protein